MLWIVIVLLAVAASFAATIVCIDSYQYRRNQVVIRSFPEVENSSRTLVTFFSRSGNTELMARKIAELKNARILPIRSERDQIGLVGWLQSLRDARKTEAEITPSRIDLSSYDTIYIGSPIWLYSPAPPVFEFASANDFSGKKVFLFNSMNSKFEQKYIDRFKTIIQKKGGTFEGHFYIVRGRMTRQIQVDAFLNEVERILKK